MQDFLALHGSRHAWTHDPSQTKSLEKAQKRPRPRGLVGRGPEAQKRLGRGQKPRKGPEEAPRPRKGGVEARLAKVFPLMHKQIQAARSSKPNLSGKLHSKKLVWDKLKPETFGQNFRSKLSIKTFGQNFRSKLSVKTEVKTQNSGTQTLYNFYFHSVLMHKQIQAARSSKLSLSGKLHSPQVRNWFGTS